jgi:hypothetical protein
MKNAAECFVDAACKEGFSSTSIRCSGRLATYDSVDVELDEPVFGALLAIESAFAHARHRDFSRGRAFGRRSDVTSMR